MKNTILLLIISLFLVHCGDGKDQDSQQEVKAPSTLTKSPENYTEFEKAIADNQVEKVEEMLDTHNDGKELSDPDLLVVTLDHIALAVKNDSTEMVKTLLPFGERMNNKVIFGLTKTGGNSMLLVSAVGGLMSSFFFPPAAPIFLAAAAGGGVIAGGAMTVDAMSDDIYEGLRLSPSEQVLQNRDSENQFLLHRAIKNGNLDMVKYLVNGYYDVAIFAENDEALDGIEAAKSLGHTEIAEFLKEEQFSQGQIAIVFDITPYKSEQYASIENPHAKATAFLKAAAFLKEATQEDKQELYDYARDYLKTNLKQSFTGSNIIYTPGDVVLKEDAEKNLDI